MLSHDPFLFRAVIVTIVIVMSLIAGALFGRIGSILGLPAALLAISWLHSHGQLDVLMAHAAKLTGTY